MTSEELLSKLIDKLGNQYIVETSFKSWQEKEHYPVFKTVIKERESGKLLYECVTPKMIGNNTFERSKESHLETVFFELATRSL